MRVLQAGPGLNITIGLIAMPADTSDYRAVDGIQIPFAVDVTRSLRTIGIALTKVEVNKPLDEAIFTR